MTTGVATRNITAPGSEWMGEREFDAAEEENTGDPLDTYNVVVQRALLAQRLAMAKRGSVS